MIDFILTKFQNLRFLGQYPTLLDPYRQRLLSCIFLKKAFSRSFFYAPLDFILWFYPFSTKFGSITYERLFYKPIEAVLFLMNTVDDIPG